MDSEEADEENKLKDGKTLLYVFECGFAHTLSEIEDHYTYNHTLFPTKRSFCHVCHDKNMMLYFADQYYHIRDSIGDCVLAGDKRWAGTFGVNVDFVARSHCSVAMIAVEDVQVFHCFFD